MGEYKTLNDTLLAEDWKSESLGILRRQYPQVGKKKLKKFLNTVVENSMKNYSTEIRNNHTHQSLSIDLATVYTWLRVEKPIIAGFGTFFKNQEKEINPVAIMLDNFMTLRKSYKGLLEIYDEDTYEYSQADRNQGNEKTNANSYYGCSGAKSSNYFNIFTAAAVTATGQSLISTTQQAFEAFVSGKGYYLNDMDQCYTFMNNIIKEKTKLKMDFLEYVTVGLVIERIRGMFYDPSKFNEEKVYTFLMSCTSSEITRIYYKNNLYEFVKIPFVHDMIDNVLQPITSFKDPNNPPAAIVTLIDKLWVYLHEFVAYIYSPIARVQRLKNDTRQSVVGVDTDSNMIYIFPWVDMIFRDHVAHSPNLQKIDPDEMSFIAVNIICYVLTQMITSMLQDHTRRSNVLPEYRSRINMKNEYLFWKMIMSNTKKRYVTLLRLREGKELSPAKLDVKGIDFMKSTTREATKMAMIDIVKKNIMDADEINVPTIFRELENLESTIVQSLSSGSKEFLIPISVKEMEAYKEPLKNQGIKAIMVWNIAHPDMTIELPAKVDMVKVNIKKEEDLEPLRNIEPEIYDRLVKGIFNGRIEKFRKDGFNVIAIPQNFDDVPEWIQLFTDYDTISNDNMSRFNPIVTSLGINTINTSKKTFITNILSI